jgi:hypothetical protein
VRVLVDVTPTEGERWQVELAWTGPAGEARTRSHAMGRLPAPGLVRPLGSNAPASDEPHASLGDEDGAELAALVRRAVEDRGPVDDDVVRLGLHLFDSLLGREAWDAVIADAMVRREQDRTEVVELALRFAPSASELHAPLWEAMHDRQGFIAAGRSLPVAVTRIVADRSGRAPTPPRQIAAPMRLLFAIGADLSDPAIRPGAEFVGLLQRLEKSGDVVASHVLERASLGRLHRAVTRFRPDVVHFICHGEAVAGEGVLRLPSEDDARARGTEVQAGADRLLVSLALPTRAGQERSDEYPPLVVLSACETGGGAAVSAGTVPLAVRLVEGGVPVVVAMSGRVSDVACRLFTRQMGETLAGGGCLVTAAARARRTAFLEAAPPADSVDWALPAVFLSAGVPADFAPVDPAPGVLLHQRMRALNLLGDEPVFCGRRALLADLDDLLDPTSPLAVLVAFKNSGPDPLLGLRSGRLGKKRLLKEFAARALRGGHFPCLVEMGDDPPRTVGQLGAAVLLAADKIRSVHGLPPGVASKFLPAAHPGWNDALREGRDTEQDRGLLLGHLNAVKSGKVVEDLSPQEAGERLSLDLSRLAEELRALPGAREDVVGRVLVLLGNVQGFDLAFEGLFDGLLTAHGLGTMEEPVPVALTWDTTKGRGAEFDRQRSKGWGGSLKFQHLQPFVEHEESLAYQWVLLHPRIDGGQYSLVSWIVREIDGEWFKTFHTVYGGWPGGFDDVAFHAMANISPEIVPAGDEDLVRTYLQHENG